MRKADNLPPSCAVVTKSGNLNFLEPSESVQACNGTALAFFSVQLNTRETFVYMRLTFLFSVNCARRKSDFSFQAKKRGS